MVTLMNILPKRLHTLACLASLCLLAGCGHGFCSPAHHAATGVWHPQRGVPCDAAYGYEATNWRDWQGGYMVGRVGYWRVDAAAAAPASSERHIEPIPSPPVAPMPGEAVPAPGGEKSQQDLNSPK